MAGFTYIPFKGECIDNPALEAGDIVLLDNIEGKSHRTIITTYEYKFDGLCKIEATGTSEREHNCPPSDQRIYSRLIKAIGKKQQQLDALDLAIISATNLIASALGGYVIKGEGEYEGNLFIADNPDITQAVRVWRWNIGGFGYSDNGVDGPYETAITADKTIIANALLARIITGEMIKANSITGEHIRANTITGDKIQAGTITGDKLQADTVEANKLTSAGSFISAYIGEVIKGINIYEGLFLKAGTSDFCAITETLRRGLLKAAGPAMIGFCFQHRILPNCVTARGGQMWLGVMMTARIFTKVEVRMG